MAVSMLVHNYISHDLMRKWLLIPALNSIQSFADFGARSRYLKQGYVIASHGIMWDEIPYLCMRYPLPAPKSSIITECQRLFYTSCNMVSLLLSNGSLFCLIYNHGLWPLKASQAMALAHKYGHMTHYNCSSLQKRWRATACCEKSKFAISSGWLKKWSVSYPDDIITLPYNCQ